MNIRFAALLLSVFCLLNLSAQNTGILRRTLNTASGGLVKTLDPAQADDIASRDLTALVYDTLVQYDYHARPYKLVPSMLAKMPEVSADFRVYTFELKPGLRFAADPAFKTALPVTADDVKFSILRIADARNHSPVYWMFRGKIAGLNEFRADTMRAKKSDMSMYDRKLPGFEKISDRRFRIILTSPDPRFLYMLAMPNAAVVSRQAVKHYGSRIARHPVGSGPFILTGWIPNLRLEFRRNPDFRPEYAPGSTRKLPLLDQINVFQIRQMMTAWMMFLQGNLDLNAIDKDNIDMLTGNGELIPALKARKIKLLRLPEFEVRYIGFNFNDEKVGKNLKLRQALSLSYNVARRVAHASGQLIPAQGAIPPGVAGFDPSYRNEFARYDLQRARQLLAEAGYPNGIDPATGEPLTLTFDQSDTGISHRQMGELAVDDWSKLGINVVSVLNSKPRFFEKLRRNNIQLFRLSWIGDYPDAENFLQLFYSGNRGSCNRCNFSDAGFDRMFEKVRSMPDSPERTELYRQMVRYLGAECAWIYEGFPVSSMLCHQWLKNYIPHDFSFVRWKYLDIDPVLREKSKSAFTPLSFRELSGK